LRLLDLSIELWISNVPINIAVRLVEKKERSLRNYFKLLRDMSHYFIKEEDHELLEGPIEIDETKVGSKRRGKHG
jgi:hypothetical protein